MGRKLNRLHLVLFSAVLMLVLGCEEQKPSIQRIERPEPQFRKEGMLQFKDSTGKQLMEIEIELADDQYERSQGMMYRKSMAENRGMLFIFPEPDHQSFWMKNCYVSLDMIFVGADMKVVSIQKNTPIMSTAAQPSNGLAQYVIEVNAGFSDRYGIYPGVVVSYQIQS